MLRGMFSRSRLLDLVDAMQGRLVIVYGDIVADRFVYGTPKRISREAPVLILRQYREDLLLGGGGNAIQNILTLGGLPIPVAVVGSDRDGNALIDGLESRGVDCSAIMRLPRYRTPTKTRVLGGMPHASRQQIVRYDLEDVVRLTETEIETFGAILRQQMSVASAALISDYGYGTVTQTLVDELTRNAHGKPVTLDSRYDILRYPGVTAATPNEEEVAATAGVTLFDEDESRLIQAGRSIQQALDCEAVLITRGSRGMALVEAGVDKPIMIPVHGPDQVADVTGAGDTVIAAFTLALAAGAGYPEASAIANYCGGVVVMKMGTATVSSAELRHVIERDETLDP
jgi:D-glycero-beta-D-manno-heptose-7-phosphate kinase